MINPIIESSQSCIICLVDTPEPLNFVGTCTCRPAIHPYCMTEWMNKNKQECPIFRLTGTPIQPKINYKNMRRISFNVCIMCILPSSIILAFLCYLLSG